MPDTDRALRSTRPPAQAAAPADSADPADPAAPAVSLVRSRRAFASPRAASAALVVGTVVTGLGFLATTLATGPERIGWEIFHWDVAALTALVAVALSVRGSTGLALTIRRGSVIAMGLWFLGMVAWTMLVIVGRATIPSVSLALAVAILLPGSWMLRTSLRGRMTWAEEAAVYLDNGLVFLATAAVLLFILGPTAYAVGGVNGLLVALYPTVFIGAAFAGLVPMLATRQPLRLHGGLAFTIGVGLAGIAFAGWLAPTALGLPTDRTLNVLFSVGPLVCAYGTVSWSETTSVSATYERLAGIAGWCVGPLAVLVVTMTSILVQGANRGQEVQGTELLLHLLSALAVTLLVLRFGLHLHERGKTLAEVRRLHTENELLVSRLRRELEERERVHARLVDASRMSAVGELASAIAHEVNNPLTGVLGYAELLLADATLDHRTKADLEVIRTEALRVRDRVRSLMDFAAPRRPELVSADLATVVGAPIALLRYHFESRGVTIDERHEPMAPVQLDPSSMQQVVINVISDMAAALPGGGRLMVTSGPSAGQAQISVEADGPEVDLEALAAAFQPFDEDGGDLSEGHGIAASLGVLRGHHATIGLRGDGALPRVEIHLPTAAVPTP